LILTVDFALSELSVVERVRRELEGARDYEGAVQVAFDDLIIRLVRFVSVRIDAARSRFPYLNEVGPDNEPKEIDLQKDLFNYLASTGYPAWERSDIASGRTDIVIPHGTFNFVIETKQSDLKWQEGSASEFVAQASAYHQTDVRLGVLAVLDLSSRRPGEPHLDACFFVAKDNYSRDDTRTVLVARVPGNKRTPSDQ
jgi:hypothetical protein